MITWFNSLKMYQFDLNFTMFLFIIYFIIQINIILYIGPFLFTPIHLLIILESINIHYLIKYSHF